MHGVRFQSAIGAGPVGLMTTLVEKIDSSKIAELVITDTAGMTLPRTWIEYKMRGSDAGRETLVRELAGTVVNCFLSGWAGLGAIKLMRSDGFPLKSLYNPLNFNHKDGWIHNKHLNEYAKLFTQSLRNHQLKTSEEVLGHFVQTVLDGLESTDGIGRLPQFRKLSRSSQAGRLIPEAQRKLADMLVNQGNTPLKTLQKLAHAGELTAEVRLMDKQGGLILGEMDRETAIRELKAFVDHYARRIFPKGKVVQLNPTLRGLAMRQLHKVNKASWLPTRADGLLAYTRKSKLFMTFIPLVFTILVGASVGWLNRWWTQYKHGGEVFFPGETVFMKDGIPQKQAPQPLLQKQTPTPEKKHEPEKLSPGKQTDKLSYQPYLAPASQSYTTHYPIAGGGTNPFDYGYTYTGYAMTFPPGSYVPNWEALLW